MACWVCPPPPIRPTGLTGPLGRLSTTACGCDMAEDGEEEVEVGVVWGRCGGGPMRCCCP